MPEGEIGHKQEHINSQIHTHTHTHTHTHSCAHAQPPHLKKKKKRQRVQVGKKYPPTHTQSQVRCTHAHSEHLIRRA